MGCGDNLADVLVALCTYRGRLPQGASTSPALANLVLLEFDAKVDALARSAEVRVTRTADDLYISGPSRLAVIRVQRAIECFLLAVGFRTNPSKRFLAPHHQRQLVHNLVVNNSVSLPKRRQPR